MTFEVGTGVVYPSHGIAEGLDVPRAAPVEEVAGRGPVSEASVRIVGDSRVAAGGGTDDLTPMRPRLRGWIHAAAAVAAVPAGMVLLVGAGSTRAAVAVSVFAAGLVMCFGTSAAYHRLAHRRGRRIMQRADHAMIYVLIAGTYTPVCLLALPWSWGLPLLSSVWAVAGLGIGLKVWRLGRYRVLEYLSYLVLGWCVLVVAPDLVNGTTSAELLLLALGGVLYTAGVPVLALRRPDPWPRTFGYHEVWHAFTVIAAACHVGAVLMLTR